MAEPAELENAIAEGLKELETLYQELPAVPCLACGGCCVSPTCTLLEFLFLMRYLLRTTGQAEMRRMICAPPVLHPEYEGNLRCKAHDATGGRCLVHPARTLACRLFGLPALSEFPIAELENCRRTDPSTKPAVAKSQIEGWIGALTRLNSRFASFYCEPYWIAGLNLECWLAVYFDPLLNDGILGSMKTILRNRINLGFLDREYIDKSGFKEKADKISLLYELLKVGDREAVRELSKSIRKDFPMTGTYYLDELDKIDLMVK